MSQSAHLFRLIDQCDAALDKLWEEAKYGPYYLKQRAQDEMAQIQERRDELAAQLEVFLLAERQMEEQP